MTNDETQNQQQSSTSPREETKDATAPPANPEVDQEAVEKGRENIDRVSGN
ncbi:MAG TPA: hypothetical protein VF712_06140 [Thermoleophilaceae bacterium]|jgi:hypothetical protein